MLEFRTVLKFYKWTTLFVKTQTPPRYCPLESQNPLSGGRPQVLYFEKRSKSNQGVHPDYFVKLDFEIAYAPNMIDFGP